MSTKVSVWVSEPHFSYVEIAHACGVRRLVLDIEHGVFPLHAMDQFIAFCKAKGMQVLSKVAGPYAEAIQQAIDCGSDGVIVPHILNAEHAREVCATAKFPPTGTRSYYGGRPVNYLKPAVSYFADENRRVQCLPMIEAGTALDEVEKILALDVVDGLFPGPTDLALSKGQGFYTFDEQSRADILRCANAVKAAGKYWVLPAWTPAERSFAQEHGAAEVVLVTQYSAIRNGLQAALALATQEGFSL